MTAIVAILRDDQVIVATDSLAHYEVTTEEGLDKRPLRTVCKTFLLPQYKSLIAARGSLDVALSFYQYMNSVGNFDLDVRAVMEQDFDISILRQHSPNLREIDIPNSTIHLFGYDVLEDKFKGFQRSVSNGELKQWTQILPDTILMKPAWMQVDELSSDYATVLSAIKSQKREDDLQEIEDRAMIGGEILMTICNFDVDYNAFRYVHFMHPFDLDNSDT